MAGKKKQKQVLDHDPLAWLESDHAPQADQSSAHSQAASQSSSDDPNPDAETGYGFFNDETDTDDTPADSTSDDGNQAGYGFFDEVSERPPASTLYRDDTSQVIHLGSELTIQNVAACKQLIDETLHAGVDIKLAAGGLHKIDTAGLQLLFSLKQTLEKSAQGIHWQASSSIIDEAAVQLGLNDLIGDGQDDAAFGFFDDTPTTADTDDQQQDSRFGFF